MKGSLCLVFRAGWFRNTLDIVELKICLKNINRLEEQIRQLNAKIATLVDKNDVEGISKVPGIGEVSASAVIAEIADTRRFQNERSYTHGQA